jgi:hypothetical protein
MSTIPNRFHGSTTFNSKIRSYDHLAQRVRRTLGEPLVDIEVSSEQIYEFIDIAIEWFTKFSGVTEEYLIFKSDLYDSGIGLKIDKLFSITPEMYNSIDSTTPNLSAGYDFDMDDYRKVVDVFSIEQGNTSGVNTLFTIEHTIAQQAYFGHLLGNVGYDLITWNSLKEWLDTREKLLALKPYFRFNPDTQILKLIPEPNKGLSYYGLVGCKVQKPIKDLVSQLWVFRYVTALTKISVGNVRGKYSGTNLFGGQTVNYQDFMTQGIKEKEDLEKELMTNYVDSDPVRFFIGIFTALLSIGQFSI